jgi:hypothetical protein
MVQVQQTRIISEDVTSSVATEEYSKTELIAARENFWQYRITMNPRLILRFVIDFIAWCVGHDPELRVIYTSFSDRLSSA